MFLILVSSHIHHPWKTHHVDEISFVSSSLESEFFLHAFAMSVWNMPQLWNMVFYSRFYSAFICRYFLLRKFSESLKAETEILKLSNIFSISNSNTIKSYDDGMLLKWCETLMFHFESFIKMVFTIESDEKRVAESHLTANNRTTRRYCYSKDLFKLRLAKVRDLDYNLRNNKVSIFSRFLFTFLLLRLQFQIFIEAFFFLKSNVTFEPTKPFRKLQKLMEVCTRKRAQEIF